MNRSLSPRIDTSRAAQVIVVCGSSGSGKSGWVKHRVAAKPRAIAWDVDDEYSGIRGWRRIDNLVELVRTLQRSPTGRFAFVPKSLAQFELWARAAFAWGECAAIAEELADVTSPGKAPAGWGQLVRRGRKRAIELYAVTQRPSESDKTVFGNATLFHVCALARDADRAYMARELDVDQARIDELRPLAYIEKNRVTGTLEAGNLVF